MQIEKHKAGPAKPIIQIGLLLILCLFLKPALGQEYSAKDSAVFQKALSESHSDFGRINYQLKLAEYSIRKPGSYKIDLDNARRWITQSQKLNEHLKSSEAQGHILLEECYLDQESGTSPKGKAFITEAIPLLKNANDKYLLASAYNALAGYYRLDKDDELKTKIALVSESVPLFQQSGNQMKTASTLQYLADLNMNLRQLPQSIRNIKESLAIYNAIHYDRLQGLYDLLGSVYYLQTDYDNSIKYELMALKTAEILKDSSMQVCEINNHLGIFLTTLKQLGQAAPYFKSAQVIAKKNKDTISFIQISLNLTDCFNKLNKPKDALKILDEVADIYKKTPPDNYTIMRMDGLHLNAFIELKRFDLAKTYADKILVLINPSGYDDTDLLNAYRTLIYYYFSIKNYPRELSFLNKYQQLANKINDASRRLIGLKAWYKLDSARQDYKKAFYHLLQSKTLDDSIFNEKKVKQIAQIQINNETEQKEDEIRLKSKDIQLLTQNARIDRVQLKGAQLSRNVTMAGILVFVLISGMQYRRFNEKQKMNVLITDKNAILQRLVTEKEWLLKEVHHRVKNNLHTVICLLESQAAYLENDALKAIESSQHRIFAMSLIHQRLYQSPDIQTIDTAVYLPEFIMYLRESFGSPNNITFLQEIESIKLDVSQAIPVALIVNEAVTNAIKYAFPDNRPGTVKIKLLHQLNSIKLFIEDNGIGIQGSIAPEELSSLGLELIRGLTDDLKGEVRFAVNQGTSIIVSFKRDPFNIL